MRTFILSTTLLCSLTLASLPAWAVVISISADLPVVYNFENSDLGDESATGIVTALIFPSGFGIGLEQYGVSGKINNATAGWVNQDFEYDVSFADVFYQFPLPLLNIIIGGGLGKGKFDLTGLAIEFEDPTMTQLFFTFGYPFGAIFDVHVGYHRIVGDTTSTGGNTVDLDSQMFTLGARIDF